MLFITNRNLNQGLRLQVGRKVSFSLDNNLAGQSVYFCKREAENQYTEIGGHPFMAELKASPAEQILFLIHGFSNLPEPDIFPRALTLQRLFDATQPNLVQVVPLIWPCDNDTGVVKDYWDDQKSADASAFAFSRLLEMFLNWRALPDNEQAPCLKRINVLSHSMGNRVLRETLCAWAKYDRAGEVPLIFRNLFMVAADIVNESLERCQDGQYICQSARNVSVYFASDDMALRASKVSNLKNKIASRRLGHTGPENMTNVPTNVFAIDCDDINTQYDRLKGHSYFLTAEDGNSPGAVFKHIANAVISGRVQTDDPVRRLHTLRG